MASPPPSKHLLIVLLLAVAIWANVATSRELAGGLSMVEKHQQWTAQHGKVYKDDTERALRLKIFQDNVRYIESFNRGSGKKFTLGVNEFADLTNEEFKAMRTGFRPPLAAAADDVKAGTSSPFTYGINLTAAVPPAVDWRSKGAVTPVKDQGQCGCCWAFSAVAAMEGIIKLKQGKLNSLSEQQVLDCDIFGSDQGCNGGYMTGAFQYIIKNGGLTTEANYPYQATQGTCLRPTAAVVAASIRGYVNVPPNNEAALLAAVAQQPVSVAVDAGGTDFQFYSGGVFTGSCGTNLDHAITAVGYGTASDGTKYWLVKNSWGTSWGESGYIRMARGVSAKEGTCGITMMASYPTA